MKRWNAWPHFLAKINPNTARSSEPEVMVNFHYKDRPMPDEIEHFRIGQGCTFFLTFLDGGMIDVSLQHVKEIRFEGLDIGRKHDHLNAPNYHVTVSLSNGRVLEGYTDSLYSFSGTNKGTTWSYSCLGRSPEHMEAQTNLSRIVVRKVV